MSASTSGRKEGGREVILILITAGLLAIIVPLAKPPAQTKTRNYAQLRLALDVLGGVHAGDIANGERIFKKECVTCHGPSGRGDEPGASDLFPLPSNLSDFAMAARKDRELFDIIHKGGAAAGRSRLMPQWKQYYDVLEIWDIVAFVRTLHPSPALLLPEARGFIYEQAVLPSGTVQQISTTAGVPVTDRIISFVRTNHNGGSEAYAEAIFIPVLLTGSLHTQIGLAIGSDGRILRLRTQHKIYVPGAPNAAEQFLKNMEGMTRPELERAGVPSESLLRDLYFGARKAMSLLTAAAMRDAEEKESAKARANLEPNSPGEVLYRQLCASCHGVTGNREGPGLTSLSPAPGLDLTIDRQPRIPNYLSNVTKFGGASYNLSPVMPSFHSLSDAEDRQVAEFIGSLRVP